MSALPPLQRRVLIVEDDYFLAAELAALLQEFGASVLGPVGQAADALRLVSEGEPDCVLLDINLRGELAFGLAEYMQASGITVILTTGYDRWVLPETLQETICLRKPVDLDVLIERIRDCPLRRLN